MFGWFDIALAALALTAALLLAVYAAGHSDGVKQTEERWSECVGRSEAQRRERCARNGCRNA